MIKKKLTLDEQIAYMEKKGIKFDIISKKNAKNIISSSTYYFKIKSYAKIYKNNQGLYQNLEFAYLYETSKIDEFFRHFIFFAALAVEHLLKTTLLNDFNNSNEDGYSIVNKFLQDNDGQNAKDEIKKYVENKNKGGNYALAKKYKDSMSIWVFVEIIGFNNFIKFYIFYQNNTQNDLPNIDRIALESTKWLRNIAAHNNCLLIKMHDMNKNIRKHLFKKLSPYRKNIISKNNAYTLEKMMKKSLVVDFLDMIDLFFSLCKSQNLMNRCIEKFNELMFSIEQYRQTLDNNQNLMDFFEFIKKSFEILKKNICLSKI